MPYRATRHGRPIVPLVSAEFSRARRLHRRAGKMRPFTDHVFKLPFRSGLVAILLSMNVDCSRARVKNMRVTPPPSTQPETKLAVGTEVVFKQFASPGR